jgi:membrane protein
MSAMIESTKHVLKTAFDVLYQSIKDLFVDDGPQWASAVAYYALLSSLPLLIVGITVIGFVSDAESVMRQLVELMGDFLPEGEEEVDDIVEDALAAQGQFGLFAFAGLLWSGTRVFMALTRAMNIAFGVDEGYGFFHRLGVEVLMLFTVGMFFVLALMSGYLTGMLWDAVQFFPGNEGLVYDVATSVVRAAVLVLAFFLIYRLVPNGNHPWKAAMVGAVLATALFLAGSPLFRYWVTEFGDHDLIYGRMAMLIIILLWVWVVSLITIFGGEVAAHTEQMVFQGKSREDIDREHSERKRKWSGEKDDLDRS